MKKILLCFGITIVLLTSCKKNHTDSTNPSGKSYAVKFTVDNLSSSIKNNQNNLKINDVTTITSAIATKFYYIVFNSQGKFVDEIIQTPSSTNFGTINDNLKAGSYTILLVAGQDKLMVTGLAGASTSKQIALLNNTYISYDAFFKNGFAFGKWGDTFYKKISLTVTDANVSQNVSLDRIVGELEINVTDTIPADATNFFYRISDEDEIDSAVNLKMYKNDLLDDFKTITLADSVKGKPGFKFYIIVANTKRPFSVSFSFEGSPSGTGNAGGIGSGIKIDNVTCQVNTRTILSGNVFAVNSNFQVNLNAVWDPVPFTTIHF